MRMSPRLKARRGRFGPIGPVGPVLNTVFDADWTGSNGSQTYSESSSNAAPATFYTTSQISTAQFVSTPSSLLNDNGVSFPHNDAYVLGTKDFLIETRVRWNSSFPTATGLIAQHGTFDNRAFQLQYINIGGGVMRFTSYYDSGGTQTDQVDRIIGTLSLNTWYKFTVTRTGSDLRMFFNDIQQGAIHDIGSISIKDSPSPLFVGGLSQSEGNFDGYLDDTTIQIAP